MTHTQQDVSRALDRPGAFRALRLAAGHINVSTPNPTTEAELLSAILDIEPGSISDERVGAFLDESDIATIADLVISGAASYAQLSSAAKIHLSPNHETRRWLNDRAAI